MLIQKEIGWFLQLNDFAIVFRKVKMAKRLVVLIASLMVLVFIAGCPAIESEPVEPSKAEILKTEPAKAEPNETEPVGFELVEVTPAGPIKSRRIELNLYISNLMKSLLRRPALRVAEGSHL